MTQQTARGLASLGRGPDTELVHMTKGEVAGLQKLAQAHGGSLTVNPHTGLPEAGFLSSLLPMVIGGALAATGVGAPLAAAMVAGGYGIATGSLKQGLMAGLGAYGGAGLGAGIMGAGESALGAAGQTTVGATGLGGTALPAAENAGLAGLDTAPSQVGASAAQVAPTAAMPAVPTATAAASPINPLDANAWGSADTTGLANTVSPQAAAAAPIAPVTADVNPTDMRLAQGLQTAPTTSTPSASMYDKFGAGLKAVTASSTAAMDFAKANSGSLMAAGAGALGGLSQQSGLASLPQQPMLIRPYTSNRTQTTPQNMIGANFVPGQNADTSARQWFANNNQYTAGTPYAASTSNQYMGMAAGGGVVEQMSNANSVGQNTGYPMAAIHTGAYATPTQQPISQNVIQGAQDTATDPYTGEPQFAAGGGISTLGGYSDGGQLLRGPGDGVSDNIPAMIGDKQHARLADGEFVVPARIVSELGNGSTEAGSRQLYAMMDRVRKARTGTKKMGKTVDARNVVPA